MIEYVKGNIFDSTCTHIVNPVNCVGVMGKGLALQFKKKFPYNYKLYHASCKAGHYHPGTVYLHCEGGKTILNATTKDHWRQPSQLQWIDDIFKVLMEIGRPSESLAMSRIGCGNGGLDWNLVRPILERRYDFYKGLSWGRVEVYV